MNTIKTFAATDFPFADVDTGDTWGAIKVTSLPARGTLKLGGSPITSVPTAPILVANIGTLTYTPNTDNTGVDGFNFQVRDATTFSADASMAIAVTLDILVLNGGFEDPTPHNPNNGTNADWTDGTWAFVGAPWTASTTNYGRTSTAPMVGTAKPGNWIFNLNGSAAWIHQDLGTTVNAGDTLAVTFYLMSDTAPGQVTATFTVGSTDYSQTFSNPQNNGTWVPYTLTQTVGVSGNLSLKFTTVSGRAWLDNVGNVSETPAGGAPTITGGSLSGALSSSYGTASSPATFTLAGANMTAGILVTAPSGLEVSQASGSGYATTTTVGSAGTIATTTVYVRLSATAPVGSYNSQNIVLSSSGATLVNVPTTASGNSVTLSNGSPAATIPVLNGGFETTGTALGGPWFTFGSPWSITNSPSNYQVIQAVAGGSFTSTVAGGGTYIGLVNGDDCPITAPLVQNLNASVTAGDTLAVTFSIGRAKNAAGGAGVAYFDVAGTKYTMAFDTSTMTADTWQVQTLTKTITNSGNLSLGFYGTTGHTINAWVDNISNVTVTPAVVPGTYASWVATNGAGSQTMAQDHDHDGVPNGIECFLGGNTNTTGFTTLPGVVNTAGTRSVTWTKAAAGYSGVYGSDYVVQSTTTLTGTWTDEPATGGGVTLSGNDVIYTFPSSGPARKFVRLKVMGAP